MKKQSIFWISFLTAGASLNLSAASSIPTIPVAPYKNETEEGTVIRINPDGSKLIQKVNGASVEIRPDGTKIIRENGVYIEMKTDGSRFIRQSDGTLIKFDEKED